MENDFLESIKVNLNDIDKQKIPSSDRDVYTCLRLTRDTGKINYFLFKLSKQDELEGRDSTSFDAAMSYYYSISYELEHAQSSFRETKIGGREFNEKMNEICSRYDIDFEYLIHTSDKIDSLQEKHASQEKMRKLAEEIEKKIEEKRDKKNQKEK